MGTITEHDGPFLNHIELYHRPGDADLAARFFETLGCVIVDITKEFGSSSTYMGVFSGESQRDSLNNVLYLTQAREEHSQLEDVLQRRVQEDEELRGALEQHQQTRTRMGVSHFGLRYQGFEELRAAIGRLERALSGELAGRITMYPPFPVKLPALGTEVLQTFVHTDLIGPGFFPFGQLIELQAQQPLQA